MSERVTKLLQTPVDVLRGLVETLKGGDDGDRRLKTEPRGQVQDVLIPQDLATLSALEQPSGRIVIPGTLRNLEGSEEEAGLNGLTRALMAYGGLVHGNSGLEAGAAEAAKPVATPDANGAPHPVIACLQIQDLINDMVLGQLTGEVITRDDVA